MGVGCLILGHMKHSENIDWPQLAADVAGPDSELGELHDPHPDVVRQRPAVDEHSAKLVHLAVSIHMGRLWNIVSDQKYLIDANLILISRVVSIHFWLSRFVKIAVATTSFILANWAFVGHLQLQNFAVWWVWAKYSPSVSHEIQPCKKTKQDFKIATLLHALNNIRTRSVTVNQFSISFRKTLLHKGRGLCLDLHIVPAKEG